MAHNSPIAAIQYFALKKCLIMNELNTYIDKAVKLNRLSNDDLVQIIEQCGSYLNLKTVTDYAQAKGMSYNGVKKFRQVRRILGVKFVIDND